MPRYANSWPKSMKSGTPGISGTSKRPMRLPRSSPCAGFTAISTEEPLRVVYPQWQQFDCEQVPVLITYIGGYPGHYQSRG